MKVSKAFQTVQKNKHGDLNLIQQIAAIENTDEVILVNVEEIQGKNNPTALFFLLYQQIVNVKLT